MENHDCIRKLVEIYFIKKEINNAEMIAPYLSIAPVLLKEDFARSMCAVMSTKQTIVLGRWQYFFDTCCYEMFASKEMYLTFMMFVCQFEYKLHRNIFEGFISICAVLKNLCQETFDKTGMNFENLNPDIIMEFCRNNMKKFFRKRGGFQNLVEFIRGHRYVKLNLFGPSANVYDPSKAETLALEIFREGVQNITVDLNEIVKNDNCKLWAAKVLTMTSFTFPTFPTKEKLVEKLVAFKRNAIIKKAEKKRRLEAQLEIESLGKVREMCLNSDFVKQTGNNESSQVKRKSEAALKSELLKEVHNGDSNSDLDNKVNHPSKQKEAIANYEKIVQAVMRNNSKNRDLINSNNHIYKEVVGILQYLKNAIESLMDILDDE